MMTILALFATIRLPTASTATMLVSGKKFAQLVWLLTSPPMGQAVSLAPVRSLIALIVFKVEDIA